MSGKLLQWIVALILSMPNWVLADIDVSVIWKKVRGDYYSASMAPRGAVISPFWDWADPRAKCLADTGCESVWQLIVNNNYFTCPAKVFAMKQTPVEEHIERVNRIMMVACGFFDGYRFKGDENICLRLVTSGGWASSNGSIGPFEFYRAGSGCPMTDAASQLGGPIDPPVALASCAFNGDISITHGEVNRWQLDGHTASTTASLSCSREVSATVSISNGGVIELMDSGALKSTIHVSGVVGKNTYRDFTYVDIPFKSVLSVVGNDLNVGVFGKSAVVTVSII